MSVDGLHIRFSHTKKEKYPNFFQISCVYYIILTVTEHSFHADNDGDSCIGVWLSW